MECWDLHNSGSRGRFNNITRRGLRFTETCPFFRKVSQRYPTGPHRPGPRERFSPPVRVGAAVAAPANRPPSGPHRAPGPLPPL